MVVTNFFSSGSVLQVNNSIHSADVITVFKSWPSQ